MKKLRIAAAGLGRAFSLTAPALRDPRVALTGGADPRPEARERFGREFGCKAFATAEELCREDFDLLYVATPHEAHVAPALAALAAEKHVLVEKPMALSEEDCWKMVEAARKAGRLLFIGPSHSYDPPILKALELSRQLGGVRMITALNYTDFMTRRRREPGDTALVNQAPHQVDIVRLLAGSPVRSVRAFADSQGGAYSAVLGFASGAMATLSYSGYGHFRSNEFMQGVGELGKRGAAHPHFGLFIASCEKGDLLPRTDGVMVYGAGEPRLEAVPVPPIPRQEVIDELYAAIVDGKPPLHSGEWGLETMQVCLAMQRSAREGKEISL